MVKKAVAVSAVIFLLILPGGSESAADTVSAPRRFLGLGAVDHIAVSPDLRFMATAGQGGAFLWDIETSALVARLETEWSATALAFSRDSKILLGASTPAAFLETAAFSSNGQYILTGEGWPFFTATLWDAQTTQPLRTFQGHKWGVSAVASH